GKLLRFALKRNVISVWIDLRRLLFFCLSVSSEEESNVLSDDLSDMLFLAVFVVVGSVPERPFDVNLTPFLQVLGTRLALLSPNHDGVPFGCLLLFTVRADPGVGSGKGESCHRLPVRGNACRRIFAAILYMNHFVYNFCLLSVISTARL